ncbi:MAG TPA: hypothetical protein VF263_17715 [Longimicrobiaceae bacterium]
MLTASPVAEPEMERPPLPGEPQKRRSDWIAEALLQAGLVVLSILLALAVDEWRDERAKDARMRAAIRSIHSELTENRREMERARAYHRALADTLQNLSSMGAPHLPAGAAPQGFLMDSDIVSTAWHSAQAGGVLDDMPHETVLELARVYHEQAGYEQRREATGQVLYAQMLSVGMDGLLRSYRNLAHIVVDHADMEHRLIGHYEAALEHLGTPPSH